MISMTREMFWQELPSPLQTPQLSMQPLLHCAVLISVNPEPAGKQLSWPFIRGRRNSSITKLFDISIQN